MNSTAVGSSGSSFKSTNTAKEKRVAVPGVGTAVQLPNGEVRVRYNDGSQLSMDGKHRIQYQYSDGSTAVFTDNDSIPRPVREKLEHMPNILKHLMPGPVTHNFRL